MNSTYFYKDKPILGLDIGFSSVKVMQIGQHNKKKIILGYGAGSFDSAAIKDGVIVEPEMLAKAIHELFSKNIIGDVTTRRVAVAIPATRIFTRSVNLPANIKEEELHEAVLLEAEQYIPVPIEELYVDYHVISKTTKGIELMAAAVPKKIVDSYMNLVKILGLEPVAFDSSISAGARLFNDQGEHNDIPAILIDFGSTSADITLYDKTIIVTGTVPGGGDSFTELIAAKLKVSRQEAHVIKTKYGLGVSKKQKEILECLTPTLDQMTKEIKRMIRYHEERSNAHSKIGQIVTMGGGANVPGLSEHLTNTLRLPVRMCDPWEHLDFAGLQPPNTIEKSMYVTVAGLALVNPKEIFS